MDSDKDSKDAKSRYVLRRRMDGYPNCELRNGTWCCPFCVRIVATDRNSIIQHAVGIGSSHNRNLQPYVIAQHAALGVYLKKLRAWDYSTGVEQPPKRLRNAMD